MFSPKTKKEIEREREWNNWMLLYVFHSNITSSVCFGHVTFWNVENSASLNKIMQNIVDLPELSSWKTQAYVKIVGMAESKRSLTWVLAEGWWGMGRGELPRQDSQIGVLPMHKALQKNSKRKLLIPFHSSRASLRWPLANVCVSNNEN